MQAILIVEPVSTGFQYLADCIERGYQPLAMFSKMNDEQSPYFHMREKGIKKLPPETICIPSTGSYNDVLLRLKPYDIAAVIPGTDFGVELADALAKDLHLPGNDPQYSLLHTDKYKMQQALAQAGLRHIRSQLITSVAQARTFWHELNAPCAVLKPLAGAGTVGLHFCHTEESVALGAENLLHESDMFGKTKNTFIMQEFVEGTEYVVNMVSCAGKHRMTDSWEYSKVNIENTSNAYDYIKLLRTMNIEHREMIRYAYQVLDALHFSYGASHAEYMMTKTGPVLIEVGARPMGAGFPKKLLHAALGHHLTDASLDCYVAPERFEAACQQRYWPSLSVLNKFFINPSEMVSGAFPALSLLPKMASYYSADLQSSFFSKVIPQTVDLITAMGHVLLAHVDEAVMMKDYFVLRQLESTHFGLLFEANTPKAEHTSIQIPSNRQDIAALLPSGKSLYVGAQPWAEFDGAYADSSDTISDNYDWIIFDALPELAVEETIYLLSVMCKHLNSGGRFFVVNQVFQHIPGGQAGLELILQGIGLDIDIPSHNALSILSAWKNS